MNVHSAYSFNDGSIAVGQRHSCIMQEIEQVISEVDAERCTIRGVSTKRKGPSTKYGQRQLTNAFTSELASRGWMKRRIECTYSSQWYLPPYRALAPGSRAFRQMRFVKDRLAVEVHFDKCARMIYSGCAKMTIFHKMGFIDAGIEIVPVKQFADEMSTGVSYFEQFVWDLEKRGVSNLDIPVLILGIDA